MKVIVFALNGKVQILRPFEGDRLCKYECVVIRADKIHRRWPVDGFSPEWTESEEAFIKRIAAKDVPVGAANVRFLDEEGIPNDRSERPNWELASGSVRVRRA